MFKQSSNKGPEFTFRRFACKGYSLFAALGREVKVGVLSVATLSVAAPALASASGTRMTVGEGESADSLALSDDDLRLGEAVVSTSHAPMAAAVAARTVMTFSREDIAAAGVTSINDVIKLCAGVDVRQRGAFGVQTDISVDGGTFDQITILLNGINISSPHTGHLSADFPVTAQDIERIEVLEGAAARVYGTSAFTGVINIITKKAEALAENENTVWHAQVHGYGGMYGYGGGEGRVTLSVNTPRKMVSLNALSGGYTRSDGATENSDFQSTRVFYQGQLLAQNVQADYQLGYSYKPYGANTFYGSASKDQWESNERWMGAFRLKTQAGRLHIEPAISWNRWYDHYQWHKGNPAGENFHQVDVYGLNLNNWFAWQGGKTAFGMEMRNEGIRSTKLGELREMKEGAEEDIYKYGANRTNVSAYLEHNVVWQQWTLSAGILANMNTALDHRWRFYPGVDLAYRPSEHWRLYATWNMALRMPTYTDLYYSGKGIEGTRNLKPEKTNDFSLKFAYNTRGLSVDFSPFYSHKTDMIDWVVYTDETYKEEDGQMVQLPSTEWTFRSGNYTLDNLGLRLNADWLPRQVWGEDFPLRKIGLQYAYIHEDINYPQSISASKYAMEYVRNKVVLSVDGRIFRIHHNDAHSTSLRAGEFVWSLSYRWLDRTGSGNSSYGILDGRLSWNSNHYTLYVEGKNLLDKTYYDFSYIRQPGIWVIGGVTFRF